MFTIFKCPTLYFSYTHTKIFYPHTPSGTLALLSRVTGDEKRMRLFPHPHPNKQPPEGGRDGEREEGGCSSGGPLPFRISLLSGLVDCSWMEGVQC